MTAVVLAPVVRWRPGGLKTRGSFRQSAGKRVIYATP
jgi:hypothetical protein